MSAAPATRHHEFPMVASPLNIGSVELKNRIVRCSHGTSMVDAGRISDDLIAFHTERARGGVALTILEAAGVHPTWTSEINASSDAVVGDYERLVESVKPFGMRVFQQLWLGPGPNGIWFNGSASPLSASAIPVPISGYMPEPVSLDLIDEVVEAMAQAAIRCREGGLDGVEIHSGHGYLLGSFLSPITNRRQDDYGGSPENRSRLLKRIISAVREAVGRDFPLGVRLSADEGVDGGLRPPDVASLVRELTDEGQLDFVDISNGTQFNVDKIFSSAIAPHMYEMPASSVVTAATDLPTIVTGRFMNLSEAEQVLAAGEADLVSMVRALIADPALVAKSLSGETDRIRPCIGCNQGCLGGVRGPMRHLYCAVNPAAGREQTHGDNHIIASASPRRVCVVGGGPAGLEAARVAALSGHEVVLFEQAAELGGQLRFARKSPRRSDTAVVIGYWAAELDRLGVEVRLGSIFDPATADVAGFDDVIVAIGSVPRLDGVQLWQPAEPVRGWGSLPSASSWDVLEGDPRSSSRVVVYDDGGRYEAIDVAGRLVADGAEVHFVTPFFTFGTRVEATEKGWEDRIRPHFRHLTSSPNFELYGNSSLQEITSAGVVVASIDGDQPHTIAADEIVMVTANRPAELPGPDRPDGPRWHITGDAAGVRTLEAAVFDGHECALGLNQVQ